MLQEPKAIIKFSPYFSFMETGEGLIWTVKLINQ